MLAGPTLTPVANDSTPMLSQTPFPDSMEVELGKNSSKRNSADSVGSANDSETLFFR